MSASTFKSRRDSVRENAIIGGILLAFGTLVAAAQQEPVWGPWKSAATQGSVESELVYFDAGDFWGARFSVQTTELEVSVKLWRGSAFDLETTTLTAEVRELDPPYNVVADWNASFDLIGLTGSGPGGQWRTVRLEANGVWINGTYWIGIKGGPNIPDRALLNYAEVDTNTWDSEAQRYREYDGLIYRAQWGNWSTNKADAYLRIREKVGDNECPTGSIDKVDPNPVVEEHDVTLSGSGDDADGSIDAYRWVLADGTPLSNAASFTRSFHKGTYFIRFSVQDNEGCWSVPEEVELIVEQGDPPTISDLWDDGGSAQLGTFIHNLPVEVTNRYSLQVNPGDFEAEYVKFQITKDNITYFDENTKTRVGNRWYQTFTVSELPEPGMYTVRATAYDALGHTSDTLTNTFWMKPPPPWWTNNDPSSWVGEQTVTWDAVARSYKFTGWVPYQPTMQWGVNIDFPYLGVLENSAGLSVDVTEKFFTTGVRTNNASGGVSAIILGQNVVDEPFDVSYISGDTYDQGYYEWNWNSGTILDYSTNIYDGTLFAGWAGPVYYEIHLSVDFGIEADLTIGRTLTSALKTEDLCITPGLTASVSFEASADILYGMATFGVVGTPTVGYHLPMCYSFTGGGPYTPGPCITFVMIVEAYVKVLWGAGEWSSGDYEFGSTSWGDGCNLVHTDQRAGNEPARPPFQSPRVASDGSGNAICVWIHDDNEGVPPADPDVYYSYYDGGRRQWTMPDSVEETNLFETDPRVVFTNTGEALLVVTQNQLTEQECNEAEPVGPFAEHEVTFAEQELVCYKYDGDKDEWTWVGRVHCDPPGVDNGARADGRCELAAGPDGTAMAVWVRDPDGQLPDDEDEDCDTNIYVAQWSDGAWSPMQALAQGAAGYIEPDIAYDLTGNGNAVAVWVADADGDFYTNGDRTIEYAYYSSDLGMWQMPPVPAVVGMPGVLWPTVCFDMFGQPVIVFTQRGPGDGLLPSGADYGEGVHDYLFSACSTPGGGFPFLFDKIQYIGGPFQNRARWPRITVGNTPQGPKAFVGCRSFKGIGADGYDGEVGLTMKNLESTSPIDVFPSPTFLTNDRELDWQVDLDADNSLGILRAVWVRPADNDPTADFGAGFDSIRLIEIPLGPDLSITPGHIAVSCPYPQPDQEVSISARVRNSGTDDILNPVVGFYLDEITPESQIGSAVIPCSGYQGLETVCITWVTDGLSHELLVVVDPDDTVTELNEENNTAGIPIVAIDPPAELGITPDVSTQSLVLFWVPPDVVDPANPPISAYRVYRDTGCGFEFLAETLGTAYVDSTVPSATYQVTAVSDAGAESLPADPVSGTIPPILDNHIIRAVFTDYGTSGDRFPAGSAVSAEIAWLPVSSATQAFSWEGNLRYDDGTGEANHLLADADEFTLTDPLHIAAGLVASESHNDEFRVAAAHSVDGATLTTRLEITNLSGDDLVDVNFAWMLDADLVLSEDDPREPCCDNFPWLGFGAGRWFASQGRGEQTNYNDCAGIVPAEITAEHTARLDGSVCPSEWTVSNPAGFQGSTCAFNGPVQADLRYLFELPFDNTQGCVGFDQDLAIVTNFEIANWPSDVTHTFTYTLTFSRPDDVGGDLDGDGDVDLSDLAQLLANYGTTHGASYEDGDLDGDGDVDLSDLAALLAVYGSTCP